MQSLRFYPAKALRGKGAKKKIQVGMMGSELPILWG
jgi:hypothetical protein